MDDTRRTLVRVFRLDIVELRHHVAGAVAKRYLLPDRFFELENPDFQGFEDG